MDFFIWGQSQMLLRDGNGTTSPSSLGALSSAAFMTCFWKMITVPPINDGGGDSGGSGDAKMAAAAAGIQLQQKTLTRRCKSGEIKGQGATKAKTYTMVVSAASALASV